MHTYRPVYHLAPPRGWLNDPNGLVFFNGEYHAFWQWCDRLQINVEEMHWAHAVSRDLVHWEHLPPAISPDESGAIWSGSATVDAQDTSGFFHGKAGLVALYTLFKKYQNPERTTEQQCLAYSSDGRTWTKYAPNPVLCNATAKDFRDPRVFWHEPTRRWIMIVGVEQQLFASTNLRDWTYLSSTGFRSECPDMFPLPIENEAAEKWVVSLGGTDYAVGTFDGERFVTEQGPQRVDGGGDFYAAQSWDGMPRERRVWIGWACRWDYAGKVPDFGARGLLTIPRELSLRRMPDGTLRQIQRPIAELASLRKEVLFNGERVGGAQKRLCAGDALEITATLRPSAGDVCGISVFGSSAGATRIGFDAAEGVAFVDRERCGNEVTKGVFKLPARLVNGTVKLHIFVDRCSVEVFVNDGEAVFTNLVFAATESREVSFFSARGTSQADDMTISRLAVS